MRRLPGAALLALGLACLAGRGAWCAEKPVGRWRDASVDDYRDHLKELRQLTAACAKARDLKSCDPTLVGEDDRIPWNSAPDALGNGLMEHRMIGYGWLRALFSRAEETDDAPKEETTFGPEGGVGGSAPLKPRTTSQLLEDAEERLAYDLVQAAGTPAPLPQHAQEQAVMQQVLAGREFRNLKKADAGQSLLERFGNWLNRVFAGFGKLRTRSRWLGWALTYGFLLALGVGLVVALLRLERRWRVRLVPDSDGPAAGAASARDWQLWMADGRQAAAAGRWREAIHFLYWAAISRLESKRLWPADRARTPREYLALVAGDDARREPLAALTGDFERIWYGGRAAGEGDYRKAEEVATGLIGSGGRE
ncbi:MAG TPA: DUF4129 domain-containing protein [Terracidiphilus sp.]|jgi:hypothetical protein|nr:DUF4129 domain-containing protein [Terracidiphilus sp.]